MSIKYIPHKKHCLVKGKRITLYSIGWLALLSKKGRSTLRRWERMNILPKPVLDIQSTTRWYCATEIVAFNNIILRYRTGHKVSVDPQMTQELISASMFIRKKFKEGAEVSPKLVNEDELAGAFGQIIGNKVFEEFK